MSARSRTPTTTVDAETQTLDNIHTLVHGGRYRPRHPDGHYMLLDDLINFYDKWKHVTTQFDENRFPTESLQIEYKSCYYISVVNGISATFQKMRTETAKFVCGCINAETYGVIVFGVTDAQYNATENDLAKQEGRTKSESLAFGEAVGIALNTNVPESAIPELISKNVLTR